MVAFQLSGLKGKPKEWEKNYHVWRQDMKVGDGQVGQIIFVPATLKKNYCFALNSLHTAIASVFHCNSSHEAVRSLCELLQFLSNCPASPAA